MNHARLVIKVSHVHSGWKCRRCFSSRT